MAPPLYSGDLESSTVSWRLMLLRTIMGGGIVVSCLSLLFLLLGASV